MSTNYLTALIRSTFPFFISFPSYLLYFTTMYYLNPSICRGTIVSFPEAMSSFYIVNCFIGAPLFAGILIDYVGVVVTLPIFDVVLIVGEIIFYYALDPVDDDPNEGIALIGIFFICFGLGLKDISRTIYMANNFIERTREGDYRIRPFTIQLTLTMISLFGVLIGAPYMNSGGDCISTLKDIIKISFGFTIFGLGTSIALYFLHRYQMTTPQFIRSINSQIENLNGEGNVFLAFNNRLNQSDSETLTLIEVYELVFKGERKYLKFWLVAAACLTTVGSLLLQGPMYSSIPYLGYILNIILTIPVAIFSTKRKLRYVMVCGMLLLLIQTLGDAAAQSMYLNWTIAPALPIAMLVTDLYIPILLDYDLKYFGTIVGGKKWLETFVMMWTMLTHPKEANKYFKLGVIIVGIGFMAIFNMKYIKHKIDSKRSSVVPLLRDFPDKRPSIDSQGRKLRDIE